MSDLHEATENTYEVTEKEFPDLTIEYYVTV